LRKSGQSFVLTTPLHLAPRLSISGALLLYTPYAFIVCKGTSLHLSDHVSDYQNNGLINTQCGR
jgi:hypothetical protein